MVTAIADPFVTIGIAATVVPFVSPYEPFWLGLGAVSVDLMLALIVTSLLRARIGRRTWRAVHWLAYLSWPVAFAHSIGSGHGPAARLAAGPRASAARPPSRRRWPGGCAARAGGARPASAPPVLAATGRRPAATGQHAKAGAR